jgi:hypothetical protein
MVWTNPTLSVGWLIALVVLILDVLLKVMGLIEIGEAMVIAAICAVRL